ncbi:hypothetical protein [Rhodococcus phenolicus]|uniref:hypothetical protein n=1 Tax=Rhodococcus phenolicus TaxID=263849 RepID=UPI0008295C0D|nr:hypothetical protein [Rhodococcus phenolicus]
MLVYADSDDLADWTKKPAPDNADILLREASILVADACLADLYDTDSTGLPADSALRDAMRDATCAQAEHWASADVDPTKGAGGQEPRMTVSAIDGASVSYDTYLTAPDRLNSVKFLYPTALRILRFAGLASNAVRSW